MIFKNKIRFIYTNLKLSHNAKIYIYSNGINNKKNVNMIENLRCILRYNLRYLLKNDVFKTKMLYFLTFYF